MKLPLVISLCDFTGNIVRPWAEAGYRCITVDLRHRSKTAPDIPGVERWGLDLLTMASDLAVDAAFVAAFPPCTHLAASGARWFAGKGLDALADGIKLVANCARICEASGAPYFIENPVGVLSTHWRKPDYLFDPCDYAGYAPDPEADAFTKHTCLWTGGGFVMPEKRSVAPTLPNPIHHMAPSPDRGNLRSVTPMGFAQAIFEANNRSGVAQ